MRGSSRGTFGQPARLPQVPPVIGPGSLYYNQIRQQYIPEEPVYENRTANNPAEEHLASLDLEMLLRGDNIDYDVLENQGYQGYQGDGHHQGYF